MSLLTHGNTVQSKDSIVYYLDFSNKRSLKFPERIYDYGIWDDGQTGSVGNFLGSPNTNEVIYANDPWGNNTPIWKGINIHGSNGSSYLNMEFHSVDNTKMYRASWWEKRVSNGISVYSRYYAGVSASGDINGVYLRDDGALSDNAYFWSSSPIPTASELPVGEWVLVVAHIWPANSGTGNNHVDSGRYLVNGNKLGNISRDVIFHPSTTTFRTRTYQTYRPSNYTNSDGDAIHYTCYPRLDTVDGTEPSLADLLNNNTDKAFNLINPSNEAVLINGPIFEDKGLKFDGVNDYVMTDFGEGIDLGVEELTIDVWVKVNSLTGNKTIFSSDFVTDRRFYLITVGDTVRLGVQDSDINNEIGAPITTDWMNLVVTFNPYSKLVKVYKDGEYTGYSRGHTGYIIPSDILLGRYTTSVPWWLDGSIGLFRVWNKLLSDSEIKTNFEQFRSRYGV